MKNITPLIIIARSTQAANTQYQTNRKNGM